ncbi:MAG: hypothetical protein BV456_03565 [Thermoplasmata archaeon M8B2D]|nr:MAG: hypothetical protein BV456_03565 [Thermoplasmata archaeon M8B2D]
MQCKKCGSENVTIQFINESSTVKTNHISILRKLGRMTLIIFTLGFWLLISKRKENGKIKTKNQKQAICQDCGYSWKV